MDGRDNQNRTTTEYFSEYGQDKWLHENIFHDRRCGVYVECGALDGLLHSNTLFLERAFGWTGLLIEANPFLIGDIKKARPGAQIASCALSDKTGTAEFEVFSGGIYGWSGLTDHFDKRRQAMFDTQVPATQRHKITVQTRQLRNVLREHNIFHVDFLSLDVEGAEYSVLKDYPFNLMSIDVIAVEDNFNDQAQLATLLIANNYQCVARVGQDNIWKRKC